MDYKDTLNLAQSNFPMRGNLPLNEPQTYKLWQENNIFSKMQQNRNISTESFTLHDGPPYANGHLHVGHALNKILKDIIIKYHYFKGERVYYTPGWDCHGLPIEQQIEVSLGKDKKNNLPKSKIRELCREHAKKFIEIQSREFQSFGVLGDFNNPYKTMDFTFESDIYKALCEVAKKGLIAERSKPIYWSWACKTALADAEIEYKDKTSDSIFVSFSLDDEANKKLGTNNAKAVIWTTTPWTLPANQAICMNPNEVYVVTKEGFIFAKECINAMKNLGLSNGEIQKEFNPVELENLNAINPLNNRKSKIILGEHVLMGDGSGLVHTAPGHGEDDYYICLKYNIDVIMPVDDSGCFNDDLQKLGLFKKEVLKEFIGLHIFKAQDRILELLGENLLHHTKITHSYPYCWRSHKPVIYRATKQWFILMDKPFFQGKTLRQIALEEIEDINFYPKSGYKRIKSMIENRPDWCISRQRDWGVPIAFFRDKKTKEVLLDSQLLDFITESFSKNGCDIWWEKDIKDLLPPSWQNRADEIEKCGDNILDVWFDSGSTWLAVLQSSKYNAGNYPSNMYLEGSDQHRGWFQSSLLISCAINHKAPFKNIITHGFTIDENNDKMSKSKGNVILPESVLKEYGSEILRLWVALSDYQSDLKISNNILKQISEQYRKIRNSIRFILANTNDFEVDSKTIELSEIDKWIINEANIIFQKAINLFDEYEFSKSFNIIMGFISNELSGIYFDLTKDILYCDKKSSRLRAGIQFTLCLIGKKLFHFLAPVLTYTINEAISFASPMLKGEWNDVFDCKYTQIPSYTLNTDFKKLLEIREIFGIEIDKLKKDKIIKSSLELEVAIDSNIDKEILALWLIVSEIKKEPSNKIASFKLSDGVEVSISKSTLYKCPRCWRYITKNKDCLCERCKEAIK
ncbi:isoleucine--tRNA ligase [Helicobacter sp. MIT 14-3879]|uniref:isoleucine--tRNA ligase n=1 Tax=Helicobacter sp. MIT 14-3879 TaxID=2040649 RepID=UPI000E1E32FD|nr:isoleucine--tRNA ligase [Helicobacter sp. MIT 14-3879]RDU61720.1 isoleucine--tRNA ligase [Helicobacter sp. MIT 14-3879]